MLRLIHKRTVTGSILVDDIDDGLPNKEVHRLGSTANPKAYPRDGYANVPKQACYVPYSRTSNGYPTVVGYINLNQTQRVTLSAGKGKIKKLQAAGLIDVISVTAANIVAPTLATAVIGGGNLTLTGTKLPSVTPDVTYVIITGTGAVVLSLPAILAAGGSINPPGTSIVIPMASLPGVAAGTSFVRVQANEHLSPVVTAA